MQEQAVIVDNSNALVGNRTLWMGGIPPTWSDENVTSLFPPNSQIASIRIVRNHQYPDTHFGYAFLNFVTHEAARHILLTYNYLPIPNTPYSFRLNWGVVTPNSSTFNPMRKPGGGGGDPLTCWVGDIPPAVSEDTLYTAFHDRFPSCVSASIVPKSGMPRGFGFIRFTDREECETALREGELLVNGQFMVKIRAAQQTQQQHPTPYYYQQQQQRAMPYYQQQPQQVQIPVNVAAQQEGGSALAVEENTTVFVGNLSGNVSVEQLQAHFSPPNCPSGGTIVSVKLLADKACGFVRFATHEGARQAIETMHSSLLNGVPLRLNWGRKQMDYTTPTTTPYAMPPPPSPYQTADYAMQQQQYTQAYYDSWQEYQNSWYRSNYVSSPVAAAALPPPPPPTASLTTPQQQQ